MGSHSLEDYQFPKQITLGVTRCVTCPGKLAPNPFLLSLKYGEDCPGGTVADRPPAKAGDTGSIPGPGGLHMPQSSQTCAPQPLSPCA